MKTRRHKLANAIDYLMCEIGVLLLRGFAGGVCLFLVAAIGIPITGREYFTGWASIVDCFVAGLPWVSGILLFVCSLIWIWTWAQENKSPWTGY